MSEAEVAVNAEVCERKDASPPLNETEPAALEGLGNVLPPAYVEDSVSYNSFDQKRKLSDLEPSENNEIPAKKQKIDRSDSISDKITPSEEESTASLEATTQNIEDDETVITGHPETEKPIPVADTKPLEGALNSSIDVNVSEKLPLHDGEIDAEGHVQEKLEDEPVNGQILFTEDVLHTSVDDSQKLILVSHEDDLPHSEQESYARRVEVPNNKVGVLIGKSGDTIRNLQLNSGAKIQITRDGDNDPNSSTRHVELTGSLESVDKAEQLIKDVIAEANAGGSPALVARGFSTSQTGVEQIEIQIPGDKVGVLIGKGGETIRSLQTKTSARIQLLPQTDGDALKERTVRITGNTIHVESAKELIKGVVSQVFTRLSSNSNSYSQPSFRPSRGPTTPSSQWGPRGSNPTHHSTSYNHQQRAMYPPQATQYPQSHGGYSQQPPPRAWELHRPAAVPLQPGVPSSGYGYYNQGGPAPNTSSNPSPASTPAPMNFIYGNRSQAPDAYGHQASYAQLPPAQQNYGLVYNDPNMYGQQQPAGSQPGVYGQQSSASYGKPAYGAANEVPQAYGQPRIPQPGDLMYQGPPPSQYPATVPMQQMYPFGSSAPAQQAASYNQAYSGHADGYLQQAAAVYPQQGGQPVPAYVHGGQAMSAAYNTQSVLQPVGYSQYPSSQPVYGDQSAQGSVNCAYQGLVVPDTGYAGNVANSGYVAPQSAASQPGYPQPQLNPSGYYDQSVPPQSGYGAVAPAQAVYGKTGVSAQPGYGGQYDSSQMYGQQQ